MQITRQSNNNLVAFYINLYETHHFIYETFFVSICPIMPESLSLISYQGYVGQVKRETCFY